LKVLFLGSPNFAKIVLSYLIESHHEVVAVVCQMDKPSGRGNKVNPPEIKPYALEQNIPVLQFEKVNAHLEEIKKLDFDIFVTASFGQILSREFLEMKEGRNIHPSMLPKYRGATPIQTALLHNDTSTGITIQKMRYEVDSGEVYLQKTFDIEDDDDFETLSTKLAHESGKMLVEVLDKIEKGDFSREEQKGEVSYTKMIEKKDGYLDFRNSTAEQIVGQVRAYGVNPGAFFFLDGERFKVFKARQANDIVSEFGKVVIDNKRFIIKAKDNSVEILILQPQNGKKIDIKSFLNGYKPKSMMVDNVT
jgi:methionyl-tRNA formyltransferase